MTHHGDRETSTGSGMDTPRTVTRIRRRPLLGAIGASAASLALAGGPAAAQATEQAQDGGRRAASVTYRRIPRPESVSAGFTAPNDTRLTFYTLSALDDNKEDAALIQPRGQDAADTTLIVAVHGSGGSYHTSVPGILAKRLPPEGYGVLSVNTRQHDDAINTDNFFFIRRDLEAAVETAKDLGYERIVLAGHSLGNVHVLFYAATAWDPHIVGVMPIAAFANLPWKSRRILIQDEDNYHALFEEATTEVANGIPAVVLDTQMGYLRGTTVPVTAQHFLTYRWDETSTASGVYWINRVPHPILMVRDENDRVVRDFEPYDLLASATGEGTLVPDIEYVLLPNDTDNPGHGFADNQGPLADTVVGWLEDHDL